MVQAPEVQETLSWRPAIEATNRVTINQFTNVLVISRHDVVDCLDRHFLVYVLQFEQRTGAEGGAPYVAYGVRTVYVRVHVRCHVRIRVRCMYGSSRDIRCDVRALKKPIGQKKENGFSTNEETSFLMCV
jgi:hypothetical protein